MNVKSVIWEHPSLSKKLPNNEIHIWRTLLEQSDDIISDLSKVLTEDEREKARKDKDFEKADNLRKEIEKAGYSLEDTKEGPIIKKK